MALNETKLVPSYRFSLSFGAETKEVATVSIGYAVLAANLVLVVRTFAGRNKDFGR